MPTNTNTTKQLIMDLSGRKGLSDKYFNDIGELGYFSGSIFNNTLSAHRKYNAPDGSIVSGIFNPLTHYGYMSPSVSGSLAVTAEVAFTVDMAASQIDNINTDVYFFEAGTKIHKGTSYSDLAMADDRTISNAVGQDLAIYEINGVRHLFYAYRESTTLENRIGIKNLVSGAYVTDNWLGTGGTATGTFSMPSTDTTFVTKMIPAGDGYMYILNKNAVHRVDGTTVGGATGTVTQNVLLAPSHFYLSHGIDYRNNLYIVVQKTALHANHTTAGGSQTGEVSECGVYIWNRQATFFNSSDYIPLIGVQSVRSIFVAPNGRVRVIVQSAHRTTQIREFDGNSFKLIKELDNIAYPNYENSVTVVGGFTVWQGFDTALYYYGSENPGEEEFLFVAFQPDTSIYGVGGSILYAGDTTFGALNTYGFYVGYRNSNSATISLRKVYPFAIDTVNSSNIAINPGTIFTPVKLLPRLSTVKHIDIYLAVPATALSTLLTQAECIVNIYFNQSRTAWASKNITRNDINKGYISIEVNKPFINSVQLMFQHQQASNIGVADVCPSYAVIEYDPTGTIK